MNTETEIIPGAVIDPTTNRLCALGRDIAAALGVHDSSVRHAAIQAGVTKHQGRFYDLPQIITALGNRRRVGSPRGFVNENSHTAVVSQRGSACTILLGMIASVAVGSVALAPVLGTAATTLRGAVAWQDATVKTAEELGLSCATPARAQWDQRRPVAMSRIEAAEQAAKGGF